MKFNRRIKTLLCSLVLMQFVSAFPLRVVPSGHIFLNLHKQVVLTHATAAKTAANLSDRSELLEMLEVDEESSKNSAVHLRAPEYDPAYAELQVVTPETKQERTAYVQMVQETVELLGSSAIAQERIRELIQIDATTKIHHEGFGFHWDAAFDHGFLPVAAALAREGASVGIVYGTRSELRLVEDINETLPAQYRISTAKTPEKLAKILRGRRNVERTTFFTTREITGALIRPFYNDVVILSKPVFKPAKSGVSKLLQNLERAMKAARYIATMP